MEFTKYETRPTPFKIFFVILSRSREWPGPWCKATRLKRVRWYQKRTFLAAGLCFRIFPSMNHFLPVGRVIASRWLWCNLFAPSLLTGVQLAIFQKSVLTSAITFALRLTLLTSWTAFCRHIAADATSSSISEVISVLTALLIQEHYRTTNRSLLSYFSKHGSCEFDGRPNGNVISEFNFGIYFVSNPAFRCSATKNSTTQLWLGRKWKIILEHQVTICNILTGLQ